MGEIAPGKSALVLGSSGMIGAKVAEHLANNGYEVTGVSRKDVSSDSQAYKSIVVDSYCHIPSDVCGAWIINCAGPTSQWVQQNVGSYESFITSHSEALLELGGRVKGSRILNLSSVHVYSSNFEGVIEESTPKRNQHPYALGHSRMEDILESLGSSANLRVSNSFGASSGLSFSTAGLVTHDLIRQLLDTGSAELKANPLSKRDFIPISEVASAVETAMRTRYSGNLNVASGETRALGVWSEMIASVTSTITGREMAISSITPGHKTPDYSFSTSTLTRLGWKPKKSVEEAISELVQKWM